MKNYSKKSKAPIVLANPNAFAKRTTPVNVFSDEEKAKEEIEIVVYPTKSHYELLQEGIMKNLPSSLK